ncbi:alanine racemase [Janibacter sp. G56]|uniref:alanine racemase n=1 Tax=Janibacter sp. G56 TaxID=3418717 RepID=UPI003D02D494
METTPAPALSGFSSLATIDLGAIRYNVAELRRRAGSADLMAVVKADAYGHGLVPAARAALAGGASWLGVAQLTEALELRRAGVTAPLLTWLYVPGADLGAALAADIDVAVTGLWTLREVEAAARECGLPARIHLKVDTGLARGGAWGAEWEELMPAVAALAAEHVVQVVGIFSHFAYADAPQHPTVRAQQERFEGAIAELTRVGITPQLRHLANSAATLTNPSAHYDLVRPGIAMYGHSPVPDLGSSADFGLREAMRLTARLAHVKDAPADQGVSYGHTYRTTAETTVGLVPMGYSDGVPRNASNVGPVSIGGERFTIAGRVCMDQFVVDLGRGTSARPGDEVVLFGVGADGEPTAQDWAAATDTISYELVTRVGARVARTWIGGEA